MSSVGNNSYKESDKATFWKKNSKSVPGSIKPVYGAQHPPRQEPMASALGTPRREKAKMGNRDAFQDFEENTIDAWDDGDDDLLLHRDIHMDPRDVQQTALQVLRNHSQQMRSASNHHEVTLSSSPSDVTAQNRIRQLAPPFSSSSAPNTPSHVSASRPSGPGIGVRLNTHWQVPRVSAIQVGQLPVPDRESSKIEKFKSLLSGPKVDMDELKTICWSGITRQFRPTTWKILSGYLPASMDRRDLTLQRKRQEYYGFVDQYYDTRYQELHEHTFRQIHIDIPRMSPLIPLFQQEVVQELFERILYIWAIRHPASGYVQGINDLVTPFFVVFLTEYISQDAEVDNYDILSIAEASRRMLEADTFWCFSKLLDGIQDNYTFAQPGIQLKVKSLKDLTSRIDSTLHEHLEKQHVEYLQFSFRWMNNLLMREMPLRCVIRLWDTYLSETDGFASFHLYVCAAFLTRFSQDLMRERDFQGLMIMLQNLPTHHWTNEEIGLVLAEAYKLKYMFADAPNHLAAKK